MTNSVFDLWLSKRRCVQERVAAMKARQEAEKARQEGKRAVEGEVAAAVASWRFGKDLLQQLTTLDRSGRPRRRWIERRLTPMLR